MGTYLNPGNRAFEIAQGSQIYVDKSGLLELTNTALGTAGRYICVSRPRRFGKTMAVDMMAAYYGRGCDSGAQFERLEISKASSFEQHLNRYDVIRLTMIDFLTFGDGTVRGALDLVEEELRRELAEAYPNIRMHEGLPLAMCLDRVYASTGIPFVILIDEWDCVMREMKQDETSQKEYLNWLRALLKDKTYVGLAYATGILPVRKYGQHSALNMFDEVSMLDPGGWACFTGFTQAEVDALCGAWDMDFEATKRWYDGYDVGGIEIYNPQSVVTSMQRGNLRVTGRAPRPTRPCAATSRWTWMGYALR